MIGWEAALPLLVVLSSLIPALVIFALGEDQRTARTVVNLAGAGGKLVLVGIMLLGVARGTAYEWRVASLPGLPLVLRADALGMLFVTLSAVLWLLTTVYAVGYLEGSPNRRRFFGFFSLCVASTMGIALAGNLFTFVVFYELLTITTYPLVVHRGTPKAIAGGTTYLRYMFVGGSLLLAGTAWLYAAGGTVDFQPGGSVRHLVATDRSGLVWAFAVLVAGFGVKAALIPLHGWLPVAMVAPAPVSTLLHAVAVVKAGAFGIVRLLYNVYGVDVANLLGLLAPLRWVAAATIVYGSIRALAQDDLKRRLAYSTVSQVSYIALGVATFGPVASVGGIVHLVHQGLMKVTLFFCAGNIAETTGLHRVSELRGIGRRMPLTMAAFAVGAFGMIGIPPVAGFLSKWMLGAGAIDAGEHWIVAVLVTSGLLNAAYFLPILHAAWFVPDAGNGAERRVRTEAAPALLVPTLLAATAALLTGLFAGSPFSPLQWAQLIVTREYGGGPVP
jgi:multicomponent Na+:H+ antiporter subunit D